MTQATLEGLKKQLAPASPEKKEAVIVGIQTDLGFDAMQRIAAILASSTIVPVMYRSKIEKLGRYGKVESVRDNPAAMPNCFVALNMSQRMGADVLMIMQNLDIIEGKPSWSAVYVIASINACGKFSPLRYEFTELEEKTVDYIDHSWVDQKKIETPMSIKVKNIKCVAWATEKATGKRIDSPPVTIELAVKEGWYTKKGSKWPNMPEVMLSYRTATFFGRLYAPELLMGLQTADEVQDSTFDYSRDENGVYTMSTDEIRKPEDKANPLSDEQPENQTPNPDPNPVVESAPIKSPQTRPKSTTVKKTEQGPPPVQEQAPPVQEQEAEPKGGADFTVPCPKKNGDHVDEFNCAECAEQPTCSTWKQQK